MSEGFATADTEKSTHSEAVKPLAKLKTFFDALPIHGRKTVVQVRMQTGEGLLWRDSTAYEPKYITNENGITSVTLEIVDDAGALQTYTSTDGITFTSDDTAEVIIVRFPSLQ